MTPGLVLGPVLRYVAGGDATVWAETDSECRVAVLTRGAEPARHEADTFRVGDRHYALVLVRGLPVGERVPYELEIDGRPAWPLPGAPESSIDTPAPGQELRLAFGSCRVSLPHHPPYTLAADDDERGREPDALLALGHRMQRTDPASWPHKLLMLGDQVYVDEGALLTRARIRARRDTARPPGDGPVDFVEYTWLYHEAWSHPVIRWLLSTVSTGMVWDDHDMHDDWNISARWIEKMRRQDWWDERVRGAVSSYWVYQHLGNLSHAELAVDDLWQRVQAGEDALALLHDHARRTEHENEGTRWSWCRDTAGVRVVCLDSRAGRVLDDTRHGESHRHGRAMVDDDEWAWIEEHATGGVEHLILATSLPVFLLPGVHWLEAWNEAVADGAWGPRAAGWAERMRQALDLEHWPAFQESFQRLVAMLRAVSAGERGEPPATITILSGDVHHAYVASLGVGGAARVHQAVCSPFRNALNRRERLFLRFGGSTIARLLTRALATAAGVGPSGVGWRMEKGPFFDNQVATITFRGRDAVLRIERTVAGDPAPTLETACEHPL